MGSVGNQVQKFTNKGMKQRLPYVPDSLTREQREVRRGWPAEGVLARPDLGVAAMKRNPRNCIGTKTLLHLYFLY